MTTTPSDKELFDIEADALANVPEGTSHQEWYDRRRRVLFDAGLAAGRAEVDMLRTNIQNMQGPLEGLVRRAASAEQKLAALVEGIRELIAKHDALGLSYDEILERIDALLQSAAPGESRPGG